jgi:hypothetical protein
MVALIKSYKHSQNNNDLRLIALIRQLKPQSTSREIENEEPAVYTYARLRKRGMGFDK